MPRKRKAATRTGSVTKTAKGQITPERGVWHVFGLRINLNSVLTTAIGAAVIAVGSGSHKQLGHLQDRAGDIITTVSKTAGRVDVIEKRQQQFERDYAPPVHPTPPVEAIR
jgi:hypothetical protein